LVIFEVCAQGNIRMYRHSLTGAGGFLGVRVDS